MPFLWVTLFADSVTLAFTVFAAAKRPLLIDFLTVGLAMCMLAAALHQVIAKHVHLYIFGVYRCHKSHLDVPDGQALGRWKAWQALRNSFTLKC